MKISQYKDIYEAFLSKVEDEYLASLDDEELKATIAYFA